MSFGSWLQNLGNKVASTFKKDANTLDGFFKSLGQNIANAEQTIEKDIEQAVAKDIAPIIEGIAALAGPGSAEKIILDPFSLVQSGGGTNLRKDLTIPSTPINISASGDSNREPPVITLTPKISLENSDIDGEPIASFSLSYGGQLPTVSNRQIQGGLGTNISLNAFANLDIGFNLKIELKDKGTFQLPSIGYKPGDQSGGKTKQFSYQESDGITSISAGIGFGGSITYTSNEPKTIELDVSLDTLTAMNASIVIGANYDLGDNSIRNIFDLLSNPAGITKLVKGDLKSYFDFYGDPTFKPDLTPKINDSVSGKTIDSTTDSAILDALTGLELDFNINPGVTLSAGLIAKEEGTGVSLVSMNLPISLENAISIGLDNQGNPQITDTISVDAGINLEALGFSVEDTISLPGFVYDIGSLDIEIGKFDLIPTSIADTFIPNVSETFNLANTLSFDGIKLYNQDT